MTTLRCQPEDIRRTLSKPTRRSGAVIVEMAMILPVFVTVMFGVIEFGRAMMVGQLVTNAAREGARLAILTGSTNDQVQSMVSSFLQSSAGATAGNITVTITNANAASGNTLTNAQTGDMITVQVSIPFNTVSFLPPTYLAGKNMTGMSVMRHE